jgi:hypothetical protein
MIEKTIRVITGKISAIERKTLKPEESGLGTLFKSLERADEAAYISLLNRYKSVLNKINSEKKSF